MTEKQIIDYAKDVKAELDKYGLFAEFVAPRLWFDKRIFEKLEMYVMELLMGVR